MREGKKREREEGYLQRMMDHFHSVWSNTLSVPSEDDGNYQRKHPIREYQWLEQHQY